MEKYLVTVLIGVLTGTAARIILLRLDFRQYPGYPHGYITHVAIGFIASALGAVAVPAIMKPDFAAVTFLALAAQQLREVRNMERLSLTSYDENELIQRGTEYIEGMARTFEARNYLVMGTAFLAGLTHQFAHWTVAVAVAILSILAVKHFMSGKVIGDICDVVPSQIDFERTLLTIEGITIMEVGLKDMREKIKEDGLAVLIKPKNDNARASIHNLGQRIAIAYTAAAILGSKKDVDLPEFTPAARKDPDTGRVALYIVPNEKDINALIEAVNRTPVLETSRLQPLKAKAGRAAAD